MRNLRIQLALRFTVPGKWPPRHGAIGRIFTWNFGAFRRLPYIMEGVMTKHLSCVLVALSAVALSTTLVRGDVVQIRDEQPPQIPSANAIPEKIAPPLNETTGSSESLSERLDRSDGVIRPPGNVDSGIS